MHNGLILRSLNDNGSNTVGGMLKYCRASLKVGERCCKKYDVLVKDWDNGTIPAGAHETKICEVFQSMKILLSLIPSKSSLIVRLELRPEWLENDEKEFEREGGSMFKGCASQSYWRKRFRGRSDYVGCVVWASHIASYFDSRRE